MKNFYILDMDGTLCDSMGYWRAESSHIVDFEDRAAVEPVYGKMREHYRNDVRLKPGALEFLEKARASGVKMCIATGTRRDVAEPFLEKSGLLGLVEFYIDCYEVAAFKDKPDIYLRAAERLGAEVSECAVFEDSEYCAETAHKAGFFVVGVWDKVTSREGDVKKFSDLYIESWETLGKVPLLLGKTD